MSWSITFIGKPENIARALEENSAKLNGQSKTEYDAALPHLLGLVKENFAQTSPTLKVTASGSGYSTNGEQVQRNCSVTIESIYGMLV